VEDKRHPQSKKGRGRREMALLSTQKKLDRRGGPANEMKLLDKEGASQPGQEVYSGSTPQRLEVTATVPVSNSDGLSSITAVERMRVVGGPG
jgi:hypothetical protein